jgi:hypothetical protein
MEYKGKSYIEEKQAYCDHSSNTDSYFPKNSLRTFISGNSRMSKFHLSITTDTYEKQMKADFQMIDSYLFEYNESVRDKAKKLYYDISAIYKKYNQKKTKYKIMAFIFFKILSKINCMVKHQTIADILKISNKQACLGIKEIDIFLNCKKEYIDSISDTKQSIYLLLDKMELPYVFYDKINSIYEDIKDDDDFISHRKDTVLCGIISYLNEKTLYKKYISNKINISQTTIYQICIKIRNKYAKTNPLPPSE